MDGTDLLRIAGVKAHRMTVVEYEAVDCEVTLEAKAAAALGLPERLKFVQEKKSDADKIRRAIKLTEELCSCGGSAPDDPKACDACKIYHVLMGR